MEVHGPDPNEGGVVTLTAVRGMLLLQQPGLNNPLQRGNDLNPGTS